MTIYFSYTLFLGVTNKRPFYRRKSQIEFYNQQQATAAAVAEAVGLHHQKSSSVKIENLKTERREGNPLVVGGGSNQAETAVNGMLDDEDRSDGKVRHIFLIYFVTAVPY